MTAWMLEHGVDFDDPAAVAAAAASPSSVSGTDPQDPDDHRRRGRRRRRDPHAGGHRPRQRGRVGARGARSGCCELQREIIGDGRHRRRGPRHRLGRGPGRRGQGLPHRRPGGPRRAAYGGERRRPTSRRPRPTCCGATRIDSGRATAPLAMPDGAVHLDTTPYTLDEVVEQVVALVRRRPGAGAGERVVTAALRIDGGELPSTAGVRPPRTCCCTAAGPLAQALVRGWWRLRAARRRARARAGPARGGRQPRRAGSTARCWRSAPRGRSTR